VALTSVLFTLVWFPLIGLAVSRLAGRMNLFLAGAGVNGLVLFVAGVLHVPLLPVLICLGIATLLVLVLKRGAPRTWQKPVPADIVLGVAIVFLLAVSAVTPLTDFDGRAFWLLKAKAIAHELRVDGPFFHGQTTYAPRNEYPLLVPLDAATVMIAARELDERHVRWLYALFAVALALEVRSRIGPWYGALVLWLPRMMIADEGGALSAYADIALAAFVACAFFELAEDHPDPFRLGLWLSFVVLTKNEGVPFALILLALGAIVLRARVILAALPTSVTIATLFFWRSRIEPTDDNRYFYAEIPERVNRIGDVLLNFGRHVLAFDDWGVFWIAVVIAGALLAWRRNWRPLWIAGAAIVPMVTLYLIMYLASDWITVDLVHATAPRLLIHFIGPGMYLVGYASQQDDRRNA
jgi:hypothetical protein